MTFPTEDNAEEWIVFVDGSSNSKGSGTGIIIENNKGIVVEISLGLSFPVYLFLLPITLQITKPS
jgi:hypothetical protein